VLSTNLILKSESHSLLINLFYWSLVDIFYQAKRTR